ncbi:MAG: NAD-dependent dehydratase [Peptococcaceae bacterium BICA1-8]|nr:MAG: NAD-dependent dehydratase [Peptococcaceae bacterium BICA1-8]
MRALVTGGSGFIGRWVVNELLKDGHLVWVVDNLTNGRVENIFNFLTKPNFRDFIQGDINNSQLLADIFKNNFDICYHLAAGINVQDSINDPAATFENDTIGTFKVLEGCRRNKVKLVFMSTCMVYDRALNIQGIKETHPTKPASPYAGSKIAAEDMVLSYYYAYDMPIVIVRPFNTYGPFQKTGGEGGVVAIFIKNKLAGKDLIIYGDGTQTRDLLYVEDCARFVVEAGYSQSVEGEIINAGLGRDISINDLAMLIVGNEQKIKHVTHIHPQSEIKKLLCNFEKAKSLLNWQPQTELEEGIKKTEEWIKSTNML